MSIADQIIERAIAAKLAALPPLGVDLFCGAGGFGLGLHSAGFHMAAACEWDFWAAQTYLTNLGSPDTQIVILDEEAYDRWQKLAPKHQKATGKECFESWGTGWIKNAERKEGVNYDPCEVFYFGDVRNLTGAMICRDLGVPRGFPAIVAGGPPCQGFSMAGKRDVMDERNSLVFDFMRLVCEVQPKAFIMENVTGIFSMKTPSGVPVIDALAAIGAQGGYGSYEAMRKMLTDMGAAVGVKPTGAERPKRKKAEEAPQMELAL